jgi:autotransporter translocation and assembly factor TamB
MSLRRRSTAQDELLRAGSRQQNLGAPPPRRRRRQRSPLLHPRKILRYLGILCLLSLAAYGALTLLINGERLRPKLEAALSSATGRHVEMRRLSFSLRHFALMASDLTVAEDATLGLHVPFLQARSAYFRVRMAPLLFSNDAQVTDVSLDTPIVMLRQDAAGAWNYYSLLRAANKNVADLDPPSIQVTNGSLSITFFGDDAHSLRLHDIRLNSPALSFQMNNPFTLSATVGGGGSVKMDGRAGPIDWETAGPLVPFNGLLHAAKINLEESNLVSSSPSVGGQLSVDASVESDGRMLRVDGQAKAAKLKLAAAGTPASEPLQAVFTVAHDLSTHTGVLNRCEFRVSKGTATIAGRYASGGQSPLLNLELAISDAPVTGLAPFLPALGFPLPGSAGMVGGTIVGNIKLDGPLEGPFVTGSMNVNGARVTGFDLSQHLTGVEGLDASDLNTEFEIVSWKSDIKSGEAGLNFENLEVAVAGLGMLSGNGTIAPDSRIDFNMSGIRGLTGPKGLAIPFTVRGNCVDPVFKPGR